jgi:GT2 family glycosyltransferase
VDPRIAVVIATRDRAPDLLGTLERLRALPERPALYVVDTGSSDGTPELVRRRFPGVAVLHASPDEGAAARMAGVRAAQAPFVAFCDDDSWWEPGALSRAADLLEAHPDVGLLAARVMLAGGRLGLTCEQVARVRPTARPGLPGPAIGGFVACGAVVRRDAYLSAGGFPPEWPFGGEEQPLAVALLDRGWELVYVPSVVAQHRPSARRDRAARTAIAARNDLRMAWERRALRPALAITAGSLRRALADRDHRRGVLSALRELPSALRRRARASTRAERRLAELALPRSS